MKFVMDCLCERGLWMKDGNQLYPFAINVSIEMYTNLVKCAFTHLVGDGVKLKMKTTQRPSLYLSEANKERLRDKLDWLTVTDLEDYGASTSAPASAPTTNLDSDSDEAKEKEEEAEGEAVKRIKKDV